MRILVVEDDELFGILLLRHLRALSSSIERVERLSEAFERLSESPFNVVVLDLTLKDSDADQTIAAIPRFKSIVPALAVVVISGAMDASARDKAMLAGADGYVPKTDGLTMQSIFVALHVATLNLPPSAYRSDSYLEHVALLEQLAHATT